MKHPSKRNRRCLRGVTYIEVLIASLVVSLSLAAMSSLWYVSYRISAKTDGQGVSYSIGRHALEEIKQTGFANTSEGTTTRYYNKAGSESAIQTPDSVYSATTSVTSDQLIAGQPANSALRTVAITVTQISGNQVLYSTTTYLARAGI